MAAAGLGNTPAWLPADISPLQELQDQGYGVSNILGVVGKTEGAEGQGPPGGGGLCII
jgi:hypothetical protein